MTLLMALHQSAMRRQPSDGVTLHTQEGCGCGCSKLHGVQQELLRCSREWSMSRNKL